MSIPLINKSQAQQDHKCCFTGENPHSSGVIASVMWGRNGTESSSEFIRRYLRYNIPIIPCVVIKLHKRALI